MGTSNIKDWTDHAVQIPSEDSRLDALPHRKLHCERTPHMQRCMTSKRLNSPLWSTASCKASDGRRCCPFCPTLSPSYSDHSHPARATHSRRKRYCEQHGPKGKTTQDDTQMNTDADAPCGWQVIGGEAPMPNGLAGTQSRCHTQKQLRGLTSQTVSSKLSHPLLIFQTRLQVKRMHGAPRSR